MMTIFYKLNLSTVHAGGNNKNRKVSNLVLLNFIERKTVSWIMKDVNYEIFLYLII